MPDPSNPYLDYDALHRYLWERSDRFGRIVIHQRQLADKLGVHFKVVNDTLARLEKRGYIEFYEALHHNVRRYTIRNPEGEPEKVAHDPPRPMWG